MPDFPSTSLRHQSPGPLPCPVDLSEIPSLWRACSEGLRVPVVLSHDLSSFEVAVLAEGLLRSNGADAVLWTNGQRFERTARYSWCRSVAEGCREHGLDVALVVRHLVRGRRLGPLYLSESDVERYRGLMRNAAASVAAGEAGLEVEARAACWSGRLGVELPEFGAVADAAAEWCAPVDRLAGLGWGQPLSEESESEARSRRERGLADFAPDIEEVDLSCQAIF